jgi:ubiquinone/menaquinone biosynthesis C-methylase UbiE
MKYILENEAESSRLKHQESISVYNLSNDMEGFNIMPQDTVLDAGCGAGVISLHLKKNYQFKQLFSCDYSELRMKQAEKFLLDNGVHGTKFFQCDLNAIPMEDNKFSKIICRFVYEYLSDPLKVTKEFYRVCAPGGTVRVIDLDGVVVNLQSNNQKLTQMLGQLTKNALQKFNLDFFAGRKLFTHFKQAGFKNIQYEVRPMTFKNENIAKERDNYIERFTFARHILEDTFGHETDLFIKMYLDELQNEENILFYNNFVVTGTK